MNCRPRDANRFKVNINIAAQGKVTFNLTYQELLERKKGFYQHTVFVNPGQVVDDMQIEVAIRESREITSVDATTKVLSNDIYTGTCYLHVIVLTLYECFANSKVNSFKPSIIFGRHINDQMTQNLASDQVLQCLLTDFSKILGQVCTRLYRFLIFAVFLTFIIKSRNATQKTY